MSRRDDPLQLPHVTAGAPLLANAHGAPQEVDVLHAQPAGFTGTQPQPDQAEYERPVGRAAWPPARPRRRRRSGGRRDAGALPALRLPWRDERQEAHRPAQRPEPAEPGAGPARPFPAPGSGSTAPPRQRPCSVGVRRPDSSPGPGGRADRAASASPAGSCPRRAEERTFSPSARILQCGCGVSADLLHVSAAETGETGETRFPRHWPPESSPVDGPRADPQTCEGRSWASARVRRRSSGASRSWSRPPRTGRTKDKWWRLERPAVTIQWAFTYPRPRRRLQSVLER